MAKLYYNRLKPVAVVPLGSGGYTAITQSTTHPLINVLHQSVSREFRALDKNGGWIRIDLGASKAIRAIYFSDINTYGIAVYTSDNATHFDNGTPATGGVGGPLVSDLYGRYKGFGLINSTHRYIFVNVLGEFGGALPHTGPFPYTKIGAIHIFGSVIDIAPTEWGYDPRCIEPNVSTVTPNGQRPKAATGPHYHLVNIKAKPFGAEDWRPAIQAMRAGICLFDMALPAPRNNQIWPVTYESEENANPQTSLVSSELAFTLREVV